MTTPFSSTAGDGSVRGGGGKQQPLHPQHQQRVLYPAGDRSHLPAGILQDANLTPEMLANNLRAGLFPEKGQRIRVRPAPPPTDRLLSAAFLR